jgi:hypothetical protein
MPFHYDDDKKKKKKRIIETDPAKKAWKALQSGGLEPFPFDDLEPYEAKEIKGKIKGQLREEIFGSDKMSDEERKKISGLKAKGKFRDEKKSDNLMKKVIERDRENLRKEIKGMGPEGKRFLKDKLSGKKYEGKLKPKYKKDLLKELEGMSSKGKSYVKKELGDPRQSYEDYLGRKRGDLEDKRKLKLENLKKFKSNVTKPETKKKDKPEAWKGPDFLKPKDWDTMSEKEKDRVHEGKMGIVKGLGQLGQAFSDKGAKSYVKKELGDSEEEQAEKKFWRYHKKDDPRALRKRIESKKLEGKWGTTQRVDPDVKARIDKHGIKKDVDKDARIPISMEQVEAGKDYRQQRAEHRAKANKRFVELQKKYGVGKKIFGKSLAHIAKNEALENTIREKFKGYPRKQIRDKVLQIQAEQDYGEEKRQKHSKDVYKKAVEKSKKAVADKKMSKLLEKEDLDRRKRAVKKEKGDSKNWIQGAVKKPGALRDTAKRMGLIKGDELLSSKDLSELKSKAKKSGNTLLMRRVNLAKTFKKMKK